jgi:hypothetical protein
MNFKPSTINKSYLRSVASRFVLLGVCGAVLLVSAVGCGKKAPPVAPKPRPLTAVTDLAGVLRNEKVRLTWTHRPDNRYAKAYVVLRAQRGLSRPACGDCPRVFQKVDTIAIPGSLRDREQDLNFSQSLAPGFSYTYSVRPVHGSGAQGPDSNLVTVEVPGTGGEVEGGHE